MIEPKNGKWQGYLVERMLDLKRFKYKKWNDNRGSVGPCEAGLDQCDDESADSLYSEGMDLDSQDSEMLCEQDTGFNVDDIPQAFSCFKNWFSERRFLICDLQGVFNSDVSPPVFELTDPVIHHRQSTDGVRVYGRSDNGLDGIRKFHSSHRCSPLCRMARARAYVDLKDIRTSL